MEEQALLLEGEDMFRPAWRQKCESLDTLINMNIRIADYYEAKGEQENARHQLLQAIAIAEAVKDDIIPPFWHNSIYEYPVKELLETILARLQKMI